jgi:Domain of unknown function (DUF929)
VGVGKAAVRDKRAERIEAIRAQQAREARRKVTMSVTAVVVVVAVIAVLVGVKLITGPAKSTGAKAGLASAAVVQAVSAVPASTYNAVGVGSTSNPPIKINGSALTAGGLPQILYVGAEYCPFCAAERWSIATALARFGTWTNLGSTSSASGDVYPNTQTLDFHGTTYSSPYIAFTGVEQTTNQGSNGNYTPLDKLTAAQAALIAKFDAPPYVSSADANSIPFIDIGGKWIISGAGYSPQTLAGMSHAQIAAALANPSSAVSKGVIGTANMITAAICNVTPKAPTSVCTSPGVQAAMKQLLKKK